MSEKIDKDSLTNEEYYQYLLKKYPVESFELEGKNGEKIIFSRGRGLHSYMNKEEVLCYYLEGPDKYKPEKIVTQASFSIDPIKKEFCIHTKFDFENRGYARAIYNNYEDILRQLGIEDGKDFELVINNHHTDEKGFLNKMKAEGLVKRTQGDSDLDNALAILKDFSSISTPIRLREINDIIEYAIKSKVPMEKIAEALNESGFHFWDSISTESEEIKRFKSFGIKGLKPLEMDNHGRFSGITSLFRDFKFMEMLGEVSEDDVYDEFDKVMKEIDEIKAARNNKESKYAKYSGINDYCDEIDKYGRLGFMILEYDNSGLLFKYADSTLRELVKRQAINMFGLLNTHNDWKSKDAQEKTLKVLSQSGMIDKETYIELYKRALGRNHSLNDFNSMMYRYSDYELRCDAEEEIRKHIFLPCPKRNEWQMSDKRDNCYKIRKIELPFKRVGKTRIINQLKKLLTQKDYDLRKVKAITDMPKEKKDKKIISYADNVYDWLFGTPEKLGYLQISSSEKGTFIDLPPQTPEVVIEKIKGAVKALEDPSYGEI